MGVEPFPIQIVYRHPTTSINFSGGFINNPILNMVRLSKGKYAFSVLLSDETFLVILFKDTAGSLFVP